jgi:hypothetical protein
MPPDSLEIKETEDGKLRFRNTMMKPLCRRRMQYTGIFEY